MIPTEVAAAVLLAICVLGNLLTSVGLLRTRDLYDQIHYLAPGSLLGAVCLALAVLLHEGWSQSGAKSIAIAALLVLGNPVLSHATARAGKIRRENRIAMEDPGGK
jgi:monovalent cation/proton antiporter MnhG/PhaG subunit